MLECLDVVLGSRVRGEPILEDVISGSSTLKLFSDTKDAIELSQNLSVNCLN